MKITIYKDLPLNFEMDLDLSYAWDRGFRSFLSLQTVTFDLFEQKCTYTFVTESKESFALTAREVFHLSQAQDRSRALDLLAQILYPRISDKPMWAFLEYAIPQKNPTARQALLVLKNTELLHKQLEKKQRHFENMPPIDLWIQSQGFEGLDHFIGELLRVEAKHLEISEQVRAHEKSGAREPRKCKRVNHDHFKLYSSQKHMGKRLEELRTIEKTLCAQFGADSYQEYKNSLQSECKLRKQIAKISPAKETPPLDSLNQELESTLASMDNILPLLSPYNEWIQARYRKPIEAFLRDFENVQAEVFEVEESIQEQNTLLGYLIEEINDLLPVESAPCCSSDEPEQLQESLNRNRQKQDCEIKIKTLTDRQKRLSARYEMLKHLEMQMCQELHSQHYLTYRIFFFHEKKLRIKIGSLQKLSNPFIPHKTPNDNSE